MNRQELKKLILKEVKALKKASLNEAYDEKQIAANLTKAFTAGPAATRQYLNGPEGSSEEARALLLKPAASQDGSPSDDVIKVSDVKGPALSYKPTQNYIDLMQSVSYPLGSAETLLNAISTGPIAQGIVVSKNLIIDGHHRWSGAIAIGAEKAQIQGKSVDWKGQDTNQILASAQMSIAAWLGPNKQLPSAGGGAATNILGKDANFISELIIKNVGKQTDKGAPGPLLNIKMCTTILNNPTMLDTVNKWAGSSVSLGSAGQQTLQRRGNKASVFDKDQTKTLQQKYGSGALTEGEIKQAVTQLRVAIAKKVGENLTKLPVNNKAPDRPDMPQFDPKRGGPELDTIEKDLAAGKLNVIPPYVKENAFIRKAIRAIIKEELSKLKK